MAAKKKATRLVTMEEIRMWRDYNRFIHPDNSTFPEDIAMRRLIRAGTGARVILDIFKRLNQHPVLKERNAKATKFFSMFRRTVARSEEVYHLTGFGWIPTNLMFSDYRGVYRPAYDKAQYGGEYVEAQDRNGRYWYPKSQCVEILGKFYEKVYAKSVGFEHEGEFVLIQNALACDAPYYVGNYPAPKYTEAELALPKGVRDIPMGMELECGPRPSIAKDEVASAKTWHIIRKALGDHGHIGGDGSIAIRNGREIKTVPATMAAHRVGLEAFLNIASQHLVGWRERSCGIHIHLDSEWLGHAAIAKIMVFINSEDNHRFVTDIAGRANAAHLSYQMGLTLRQAETQMKQGQRQKGPAASYRGPTLEMRLFQSNTGKRGVLRVLEFCSALANWSKVAEPTKLGFETFLGWVVTRQEQFPEFHRWLDRRGYLNGQTVNVELEDA